MAKNKYYSLSDSVTDANGQTHIITVVGELKNGKKYETVEETVPVQATQKSVVNGTLKFEYKRFHRELTVGYSVCHPTDNFDSEEGVRIAKGRINRGNNIGTLETASTMMLTEDMVMAILFTKLRYIKNHINKFIYRL